MEFDSSMVKDFKNSLDFLTESCKQTCYHITRDKIFMEKPAWANQTEKFSSFYDRIKDNENAIEKFKQKVVIPLYESRYMDIVNKIINDKNIVQDEFIKLTNNNRNENEENFTLSNTPEGIYFSISNIFLPVSDVYTESLQYAKKNKNTPFPIKILLGFYCIIYHAVKETEDQGNLDLISENIKILSDSLEVRDQPVQVSDGPTQMLQNLLGNIDLGQIGEMMGKVTGDEKASKEFGEVFSQMTDVIKNGGNPLEAMGDIIKNASIRADEESSKVEENNSIEDKTEENNSIEDKTEENNPPEDKTEKNNDN